MREINLIDLYVEELEKRMIAQREAIDDLLDADLKLANILKKLIDCLSKEKQS